MLWKNSRRFHVLLQIFLRYLLYLIQHVNHASENTFFGYCKKCKTLCHFYLIFVRFYNYTSTLWLLFVKCKRRTARKNLLSSLHNSSRLFLASYTCNKAAVPAKGSIMYQKQSKAFKIQFWKRIVCFTSKKKVNYVCDRDKEPGGIHFTQLTLSAKIWII